MNDCIIVEVIWISKSDNNQQLSIKIANVRIKYLSIWLELFVEFEVSFIPDILIWLSVSVCIYCCHLLFT